MAITSKLTAIADATRELNGTDEPLTLEEIASAIAAHKADKDGPEVELERANLQHIASSSYQGDSPKTFYRSSVEAFHFKIGSLGAKYDVSFSEGTDVFAVERRDGRCYAYVLGAVIEFKQPCELEKLVSFNPNIPGDDYLYCVAEGASFTKDSDTSDGTITPDAVLQGYVGYAKGGRVVGSYVPPEPEYDTPTIDVSEGGLITATANGKSATEQLDAKGSGDMTVSGDTVTAPAGWYGSASSKRVNASQQATPDISMDSSGLITATSTQAAGYVTAGVKSATKQLMTQEGKTVTPTKSQQTAVASGRYTTGAVNVAAIPDEYIVPSGSKSIKENGTFDVTDFAEVAVNVAGSSGKNVQCYQGYAAVTSTSYASTAVQLTVAKTGTYKVSWCGWRNTTSGTSGSQLYINGTAYGSAQTSFVNSYGQSVTLSNVSLTAGQTIVVRARARSTSYYMAVGNLTIVEV